MSEFVLIIPLIVVILALLFYMGRLVVRAQHASVMARYETWRDAVEAPGPRSDEPRQHPLLNQTFFANNADRITHAIQDDAFPRQPYRDLIDTASDRSDGARALADAVVYHQGGDLRNSNGHREGFDIIHENTIAAWARITSIASRDIDNPEETPLTRRHARIGSDWPYVTDWHAGADDWQASGADPHPLRARRDAFFLRFDQMLDDVDGSTSLEYAGGQSQIARDETFAGFVRTLYLAPPQYRGPMLDR